MMFGALHLLRPATGPTTYVRGDMATSNRKRPRSSRKRPAFTEVKGKVVERVEFSTSRDDCVIGIFFQDRTYLSFDLDPFVRITPDFSDWKTGNYKPLKRWPPVDSD